MQMPDLQIGYFYPYMVDQGEFINLDFQDNLVGKGAISKYGL